MIRKGSLVKVNDKATGAFRPHIGSCFKVADVKTHRDKKYVVIAGIGLPIEVVDYMGPQKKGKKSA